MLILLITTWLLVGRSSGASETVGYVDQINAYAKGHLSDEAQRKAVLEVAEQLKKAGSEEAKATAQTAEAIDKISRNRRATPAEVQDALSEMRGYSEELQAKVIQQRAKLKSELTREQWAVLHATTLVH